MNRARARIHHRQPAWLTMLLLTAACQKAGTTPPPEPAAQAQTTAQVGPQVDDQRLLTAAQDANNWLTHGGSYGEERFSRLKQIEAGNVAQLGLAWSLDLDTNRGQEATPIVVDGVMYTTSAWSKVQAIDVRTGKMLWQYDPFVSGRVGVRACCDVVNRGVAVYGGRVYVGVLDGRLVALDGATGKPVWSVMTVDESKPYTITGAPRIVRGRVVIGNGGAEFGVRGYVSAYDAQSGELAWRFYTVPGDPSLPAEAPIMVEAQKTWTGEWWKAGGGGTAWDSMAYDPELGLLYIGTGNGSPWNPAFRSPEGGDNLFLSSIVALNADTGAYVWHYQTTPGDAWDYTATQHIILADLSVDGQPRKVLMQAPKNGFFYVLDRKTGELLSATPFAMMNWATGFDMATGRPQLNPEAEYWKTGKPWIGVPGPYGAHNWQPMSFNPETGLVYIPAAQNGFPYVHDPAFKPAALGFNLGLLAAASATPPDPKLQAEALALTQGFLQAWDPVQKKEVWKVQHPGMWNGGVLSTAGNLVFQGNNHGEFSAFDAKTGAKLWSFDAQAGILAAPISFAVDGQQYVAVVVGWGGTHPISGGITAEKGALQANHSRVLAFKLGGTAQLPAEPPAPVPQTPPPARFGDEQMGMAGLVAFHQFCGVCHGSSAVSAGGVITDLRWSKSLTDPEAWQRVVLKGTREGQGMVGFADVLTPEQAEAIRAYVVSRANDTFPGLPKKQ